MCLFDIHFYVYVAGMRGDILNDLTVALSNDTLAVRDKANEKGITVPLTQSADSFPLPF